MKLNGQLMRPLVVIGAAALAALFLVGVDELAQALFNVEADRFVRVVILLSGILGGGAAGRAYFERADDHD
ncbi:unnamed protein product [marine sediment metagenome]|uniref:Uncharacterized protein n=1 Tax=marine sediment metagenome TaxID=412755 RepID=X0XMZ6_9ZZZZ